MIKCLLSVSLRWPGISQTSRIHQDTWVVMLTPVYWQAFVKLANLAHSCPQTRGNARIQSHFVIFFISIQVSVQLRKPDIIQRNIYVFKKQRCVACTINSNPTYLQDSVELCPCPPFQRYLRSSFPCLAYSRAMKFLPISTWYLLSPLPVIYTWMALH